MLTDDRPLASKCASKTKRTDRTVQFKGTDSKYSNQPESYHDNATMVRGKLTLNHHKKRNQSTSTSTGTRMAKELRVNTTT